MMEKLDLRYYLFHAIEPVEHPKINRKSYEKLHCFLETGYIYPGNQVNKNIPKITDVNNLFMAFIIR